MLKNKIGTYDIGLIESVGNELAIKYNFNLNNVMWEIGEKTIGITGDTHNMTKNVMRMAITEFEECLDQ